MNRTTEEDTMEVPLTKGYVALVDAKDYARVTRHKWSANEIKKHGKLYVVYAQRTVRVAEGKRTSVMLHRFVLGVTAPKVEVDHQNGNGLDCRRENLRLATHTQNQHNVKKQDNNTSGFKGVHRHKKNHNWVAQVRDSGKTLHIGSFPTAILAAQAYDREARKYYGEFAVLNFPTGRMKCFDHTSKNSLMPC
jgi:hypothetical protein